MLRQGAATGLAGLQISTCLQIGCWSAVEGMLAAAEGLFAGSEGCAVGHGRWRRGGGEGDKVAEVAWRL